jgi:hypothetical protein
MSNGVAFVKSSFFLGINRQERQEQGLLRIEDSVAIFDPQ